MSGETNNRVILLPSPNPKNPFLTIIGSGLEHAGLEVLDVGSPDCLNSALSGTPIVLNWFDEIAGPPRTALYLYRKKVQECARMKKLGCPMVFVLHNKRPHDTVGGVDYLLTRWLRRQLCLAASAIVVLCDQSHGVLRAQLGNRLYDRVADKIVKIPHPTYKGAYEESDLDYRERFSIDCDSFLFSFTGAIRPYKNIELIIDTARRFQEAGASAWFLVMGRCSVPGYLAELQERSRDLSNFRLIPEYVPNESMAGFIRSADALILPYDTHSSLNSGTCVLAFSYGRTVICPRIGTIEEYPLNLTFNYGHEDGSEEDALFGAAMRAYRCWEEDRAEFSLKGRELERLVCERDSVEAVSRKYVEVIRMAKP